MSLGAKIIGEIGRRRQMGMYFDYAGYQALRQVQNELDLARFFSGRGLERSPATTDPKRVVDWLQVEACDSVPRGGGQLLAETFLHGPGSWIGLALWATVVAVGEIAKAFERKALIAKEKEAGVRTRGSTRR